MILTARIQSLLRTLLPCVILHTLVCLAVAAEPTANVCVQCHGGLPERLGAPVTQWRGSIHAENGIFCNSCHGGDPKDAANAMSPARGFLGVPKKDDIPAFCGRCHVGVLESFRTSAHGTVQGKERPTCVTCHSNHRVRKATLDLINEKSCGQCHSFEGARLIREAMAATESRIVAIDRRIGGLEGKGLDTSQLEQRLFACRNRFHSLSHVVDVDKIKGSTREINADLDFIDRSLKNIGELEGKKKLMGAAAIVVALLAAFLLTLYRKTFK